MAKQKDNQKKDGSEVKVQTTLNAVVVTPETDTELEQTDKVVITEATNKSTETVVLRGSESAKLNLDEGSYTSTVVSEQSTKKTETKIDTTDKSAVVKPVDAKVTLVERKKEEPVVDEYAGLTAEENSQVTLFKQCLDEFEAKVWSATHPAKVAVHYNKLHHAFRIIFSENGLRGPAYKIAFSDLVNRVTKNVRGSYNHKVVNANLDRIKNEQEREVFVIFINLVLKFAACTDKANFSRRYGNVDRLTRQLLDEQLINSIEECFLVP